MSSDALSPDVGSEHKSYSKESSQAYVVDTEGGKDAGVVDLGAKAHYGEIEYTEEESIAVRRKIDWHIVPMVIFLYGLQYADKQTLNFASLMGIRTDAHIDSTTQDWSWLGSIFYAGFLVAEFPMTYLLKKLPIGKLTSANIIVWGVVLTMHAACSSWAGLMTVRALLGFFEAIITPAFVLLVSQWYKKLEQGQRLSYFLAANGMATIIISPIAYGLAGLVNPSLAAWKILYLMFGLITVVTGCFYMYAMPDSQLSVGWLNEREKAIAIDRVRRANNAGIGNYVWKWDQFYEALRDIRTWQYFTFSLFMNIPNGGIGTFGSLIISSFGIDSRTALLLNLPQGIIDIAAKFILMGLSDKFHDRSAFALIAISLPFAGGLIMLFAPQTNSAVLLFGYYLIGAAGAGWGLVMTLISNNSVGFTKKATVQGIQIIAYACGNWIGPQTFRSTDAPHYVLGKTYITIFYGISLGLLLSMRLLNLYENRRRDKAAQDDPAGNVQPENAAALDLTDFQQPGFRYIL